jgi:hypothetical protein
MDYFSPQVITLDANTRLWDLDRKNNTPLEDMVPGERVLLISEVGNSGANYEAVSLRSGVRGMVSINNVEWASRMPPVEEEIVRALPRDYLWAIVARTTNDENRIILVDLSSPVAALRLPLRVSGRVEEIYFPDPEQGIVSVRQDGEHENSSLQNSLLRVPTETSPWALYAVPKPVRYMRAGELLDGLREHPPLYVVADAKVDVQRLLDTWQKTYERIRMMQYASAQAAALRPLMYGPPKDVEIKHDPAEAPVSTEDKNPKVAALKAISGSIKKTPDEVAKTRLAIADMLNYATTLTLETHMTEPTKPASTEPSLTQTLKANAVLGFIAATSEGAVELAQDLLAKAAEDSFNPATALIVASVIRSKPSKVAIGLGLGIGLPYFAPKIPHARAQRLAGVVGNILQQRAFAVTFTETYNKFGRPLIDHFVRAAATLPDEWETAIPETKTLGESVSVNMEAAAKEAMKAQ